MKKVVFAVAAVAVALTFALPSFADEAKKEAKEAKAAAKMHDCTGAITALDAAKGSVTVKNAKDVEKTFVVTADSKIVTADKAVATLADLKVGDKVKVAFTEDAGKNTATKIAPAPAAHTKEAKPAEKKP